MDGKGVGINAFGLGNEKIYNNLIVRAGRTFPDPYPLMSGIYVGDKVTSPGEGYMIAYNTIISPKVFGIHYKNESTTGTLVTNNIIADPGDAFFEGINFQAVNNLSEMDINVIQFVDAASGNYDLKPNSPAFNQAIEIPQMNLQFDLLDRPRPFALLNDIGAYECQLMPGIDSPNTSSDVTFSIKPSAEEGMVWLSFTLQSDDSVQITLYDLQGSLLKTVVSGNFQPGTHQKPVDIRNLTSGIYVFHLKTSTEAMNIKYHIFR